MEVQFWAATDTGRRRDHNEDNFLVDRRLRLFAVCDGMGGHAAGEVASEVTVRTIRQALLEARDRLPRPSQLDNEPARRREFAERLAEAVREANGRVWSMSQSNGHQRGMGTTCSLLVLRGRWGFFAHVGDSRIYRLRRGQASQITEDHSLRNRMIREGKLREDEVFEQNNAVTRAIGVAESVEVDTSVFEVRPGDRFLLCSDGLSEYLEDETELGALAGGEDLRAVTEGCIDHANSSGGKDNVTVVVAEACEGSGVLDAREATVTGRAIRSLPFFRRLTPDEFGEVAGRFEVLELSRGEALDKHADQRALAVVCKGSVRLTRAGRTVGRVGPGDYLGARRLFVEPAKEVRARAAEDATVAVLSRAGFIEFVREEAEIGLRVLWSMAARFGDVVGRLPWEEFRHPDLLDARDEAGPPEASPADGDGDDGGPGGRPPPLPADDGVETVVQSRSSLDETVVNGDMDRERRKKAREAMERAGESGVQSGEAVVTGPSRDASGARREKQDTEELRKTRNVRSARRDKVERSRTTRENGDRDEANRKTMRINIDEDDQE